MEINKLKLEIKAREEDLLVNKLNDDKVSALNVQKISLLEKECEQWKERYNTQSKELSENKSHIINLNSDLDKIKNENKSLKHNNVKQDDINFRSSANNFFAGNNLNSASAKILVELLSGQNTIKDYIKDIMEKTNELIESNGINNNGSNKKKDTKVQNQTVIILNLHCL